jgi:phosphoglycerate kinase
MSFTTPTPSPFLKTIRDLDLAGKTVFMRLDLNVPLSAPDSSGTRTIEDDSRILESLPTIQYAIEKGARLVLASHLGRPKGKRVAEFSLEPVAHRIAHLLNQEITLADDCVGDGIELMVQGLKKGQILLLENLRFYPGEETNDIDFARRLARLGEVYITDAFGTAHRKHASTFGVPSLTPIRGIGLLIEKELQKPFLTILGGSKVSEKIKAIESLLRQVDSLLIGGAMAHAFWVAQGDTLPSEAKHPKPQDVEAAQWIMKEAKRREIELIVPSGTNHGFDIDTKTIQKFSEVISKAQTIFWNGPMGWFEKPEYATGTFEIAQAIANNPDAIKICGGGDTVSAVKKAGLASSFSHLSTGGGAALQYLEGEGLPGIDVLKLTI